MQAFEKKLIKRTSNRKKQQLLDDYQRAMQSTSKKVQQMEKQGLTQLSTSTQMIKFFGRTYTLVFTAIISSAIIYPISVRFVKNVFKLKSYFNIHFAIIPIVANWNALILGVTQGYINYSIINQQFPLQKDQQMVQLDILLQK